LGVLAALALVWAAVVAIWGGFFLRLGPIVLSSRRMQPALLAAGALIALAGAVTLGRGREAAIDDWARVRSLGARTTRAAAQLATFAPLGLLLYVVVISLARWMTPRSLWLDEESTLLYIRDHSWLHLPGTMWLGQSAPLGWMTLERFALVLFGEGDRALRLLPVLLSLATCGIAFWIGKRWLNLVGAVVLVGYCSFGQWLAHSRFEAKPYSADAFTSLLLIATAAWVLDASEAHGRYRRAIVWWSVAAVSLWLANGSIMTAPGVVLILLGVTWRSDGWRAAVKIGAWGVLWLVSFALGYKLSLQFTLGSTYLHDYWAGIQSFPPDGATITGILWWLRSRLEALGGNPGGTILWRTFWLTAVAGVVLSRRRTLAWLAAAPALTALVASVAHVVPLQDRVALWIMPGVFLTLALLADRAADWWRSGPTWGWRRLASVAALAPIVFLSVDTFPRRDLDTPLAEGRPLNHGLDDEQAIAWLLARRMPGDDMLTTHLTWSTIWWYGHIPLVDGAPATMGTLPDGGLQFEAGFDDSGYACRHDEALVNRLHDRRRVLVYWGFPDQPEVFGKVLVEELRRFGTIVDRQPFGEGEALVFRPGKPDAAEPATSERCIGVSPAIRW
jgi:hypothetical protein